MLQQLLLAALLTGITVTIHAVGTVFVVLPLTFAAMEILPDFETALYFSLKSYTTVGYGDVLPPAEPQAVHPC